MAQVKLTRDVLKQFMDQKKQQETMNQPSIEQPKPYQDATQSFAPLLRKALANLAVRELGGLGGQIGQPFGVQNLTQGIGEGTSQSLLSGLSGLSQLAGYNEFPNPELPQSESLAQGLGQIAGQGVGYGALTAPFMTGASAIAPAALPGIVPELLGAGAGGAALSQSGERIKGGLENAAPVALFRALAPLAKFGYKGVKSLINKVGPEETYKKIIAQHDKVEEKLGNLFDFVNEQATKRGVKKVNELPEEFFKKALDYGPNTKTYKLMVDEAKTGDYKSIRNLYTELGKFERKAKKTNNWKEVDLFEELKQDINDGLSEHFSNTGNKDLSQWLDAAKHGYAQLKEMYGTENVIRKLVGKNREIPKSLTPLTKNSVAMNRLIEAHPEVAKDLENAELQENFKKALKTARNLGIGAGALYEGSRLAPGHD